MVDLWNSSPIGRLLEEISWEGSSVRAYRDGGRGRENVLTVETLMLLDFLPRTDFLGQILTQAHGADDVRSALVADITDATITLLPDETHLEDGTVVQPDASIETTGVYTLVETKRLRSSSFQPLQLAREWKSIFQNSRGRDPLLLLILGTPPPFTVAGHGRFDIPSAIALGHDNDTRPDNHLIERHVAWTTWDEIQAVVNRAIVSFDGQSAADPSIRRLADALVRCIEWHR